MKEIFSALVFLLWIAASADSATIKLDPASVHADIAHREFSYENWGSIRVGMNGLFPAKRVMIELPENESLSDIQISIEGNIPLGSLKSTDDLPTSIDNPYSLSTLHLEQIDLRSPIFVNGVVAINGKRYGDILLLPISVAPTGELTVSTEISIAVAARSLTAKQLLPYESIQSLSLLTPSGPSDDAERYLIITSRALESALNPLKSYRIATGYDAEIVFIEDILAANAGVDDAEKLREYLKAYFAQSGKYVLLAGDESILPIRFAYHATDRADTAISPVNLQICDLYFADLTGDWDRDHDNTWGERLDDLADITPELLLGRLPFNRAEEFEAYIQKLIRYETDPGGTDRAYLSRSLFYSSDQMRDLNEGQHNQIASAYPSWFAIDTVSGVEATRGDDPTPSNLDPVPLANITAEGFGIINIIAHGRSDGFVLKSANYNEWPKTLLLTEATSPHGNIAATSAINKPSFVFSLACDHAQFDSDQPYFGATAPNLCQSMLADSNGAVGFVGFTRWGWVGTSYLLHQAFFDSLFAHPDLPAVDAMNRAKAANYYYRDMVYGLNYFGDPALRVYCATPEKLTFHGDPYDPRAVYVSANASPVAGAIVNLSIDGQLIESAVSDISGYARFASELDLGATYTVTVSKLGYTTSLGYLIGQIVTDVTDDTPLPGQFTLLQNYPNPFNPTTTIEFDLPRADRIDLTIFDMLGREIVKLANGQYTTGSHSIEWNGRDANGAPLPTGLYLYRLSTAEQAITRKMLLLK